MNAELTADSRGHTTTHTMPKPKDPTGKAVDEDGQRISDGADWTLESRPRGKLHPDKSHKQSGQETSFECPA